MEASKKTRMLIWLLRAVCLVAALFLTSVAYRVGESSGMASRDVLAILALLLVFIVGIFISVLGLFLTNKALPAGRTLACIGVEWLTIGLALLNLAKIWLVIYFAFLGILAVYVALFLEVRPGNKAEQAASEDMQEGVV